MTGAPGARTLQERRILGHEAVGVVEETGSGVRSFRPGDRVVVPSTVACGTCGYCRAGYYAQCDNANPRGPRVATVFFGGPEAAGSLDGLQAEYARVPFAQVGRVPCRTRSTTHRPSGHLPHRVVRGEAGRDR
ncbi:alcohol dehydrogenase catalytic domain-containing protein [Streptomyces plumbiresistens]|uniref:Alcohol dehydrogenase-like N-terminal domain-containing protein n=1 Tax=Streptomyces plumbiresistens TaxID=511811 RepID=A0ABP7RI70_9ACTN